MFSLPVELDFVVLIVAKVAFFTILVGHVLCYRLKFKGGRLDKFVLLPCFNTVYGVVSSIGSAFATKENLQSKESSGDVEKKKSAFQKYTTYEEALGENIRYIGWIHGFVVFLSLWCLCAREDGSPTLEAQRESPLRYLVGSILVYFIWDGGMLHSSDPWFLICLNLHHMGCVIALLYQGTNVGTDWHNMCLYSHLWSIHSFGFIQDIILPLFGIKKLKDGQKSTLMEVVRYIYAAGSAYHFYEYLNAPAQPGIGWNHQTLALINMLGGRLLANNNFKQVDFIRRVEMPGYTFVLIEYVFFSGNILKALLTLVMLYGFVISCLVLMPTKPKPEKMVIDENVTAFLQGKWDKRQDLFTAPKPEEVEKVQKWWKTHPEWSDKWPLHQAVVLGNEGKVRELLAKQQAVEKGTCQERQPAFDADGLRHRSKDDAKNSNNATVASGDEHPSVSKLAVCSPDTKQTDWYECTPLHYACHLGVADMVLLLLQHGANPWIPIMIGDSTSLAKNAGHKELVTFLDELAVVVFKALNVDETALEEMRNPPLSKRLAGIL